MKKGKLMQKNQSISDRRGKDQMAYNAGAKLDIGYKYDDDDEDDIDTMFLDSSERKNRRRKKKRKRMMQEKGLSSIP